MLKKRSLKIKNTVDISIEKLKIHNKSNEFQLAMDTYHNNILYNKFFIILSIAIVGMQIISVLNVMIN